VGENKFVFWALPEIRIYETPIAANGSFIYFIFNFRPSLLPTPALASRNNKLMQSSTASTTTGNSRTFSPPAT